MPRLLYVVNIPRFFVSHRLPLALAARDAGYEVHVATSSADAEHIKQIQASGLPYHPLPLSQHGTSPLSELRTIWALYRLYQTLRPDIVHQVSIKPVLYGGIAARLSGIRGVISAMSGLGYVFVGDGLKPRILRTMAKPALRLALGDKNTRMIFQNPDDRARFIQMRLISPERAVLIPGSGVDMERFSPAEEPDGMPVVLFAGRLLWQKGVGEFVEAARRLKGHARFVVVGYAEATSPDAVPQGQLEAWRGEGLIEWWGKRDDMPAVFAASNIVCLPSFYGEGVPKVLIEAAACGRPIITTDTPGCRDITRHGENGLLIPKNEPSALIQALQILIEDPLLRRRMGARGREIAGEFSLARVVSATVALYEAVLHDSS